jgi:aryl-alcohol dehydrogenase-like predicted oxidoreductase
VLANSAVTAAIVGSRRPGQLTELTAAASLRLSAADLDTIAAALRTLAVA